MTIRPGMRGWWLLGAVFGLTLLHHVTPDSWTGTHELLKRAFYVPVVIAALRGGPALALGIAVASTVAYLPHLTWTKHAWAMPRAAHVADLALLPLVGLGAGAANRHLKNLSARHEEARSTLANREAQLNRFVAAELNIDAFVTLGRVTAALLPELAWSCSAACDSLLAARAPDTSPEQRSYELGVALRELGSVSNVVDACKTLVAPEARGAPTDTADTIRLAVHLARGVLAQRGSSIVLNEPQRPMRVAMPRNELLRVLIGVMLDSGPGALVHVHTRRSAHAAVAEVRITGNHVAAEAFRVPLPASETLPVLPALRLLVQQSGGELGAREDGDGLVWRIRIPLADTSF